MLQKFNLKKQLSNILHNKKDAPLHKIVNNTCLQKKTKFSRILPQNQIKIKNKVFKYKRNKRKIYYHSNLFSTETEINTVKPFSTCDVSSRKIKSPQIPLKTYNSLTSEEYSDKIPTEIKKSLTSNSIMDIHASQNEETDLSNVRTFNNELLYSPISTPSKSNVFFNSYYANVSFSNIKITANANTNVNNRIVKLVINQSAANNMEQNNWHYDFSCDENLRISSHDLLFKNAVFGPNNVIMMVQNTQNKSLSSPNDNNSTNQVKINNKAIDQTCFSLKSNLNVFQFKTPLPVAKRPPTRVKKDAPAINPLSTSQHNLTNTSNFNSISKIPSITNENKDGSDDDGISLFSFWSYKSSKESANTYKEKQIELSKNIDSNQVLSEVVYENQQAIDYYLNVEPNEQITVENDLSATVYIPQTYEAPLLSNSRLLTLPSFNSSNEHVQKWIESTQIDSNETPLIFQNLCYNFYANKTCINSNCLLRHYIALDMKDCIKYLPQCEFEKAYQYAKTFPKLFKDSFDYFIDAIEKSNEISDIIAIIADLFEIQILDRTLYINKIIDSLKRRGLTFIVAIEKIVETYKGSISSLLDILLYIVWDRKNICDEWKLVKKLCSYKCPYTLDKVFAEQLIAQCLSDQNSKLCQNLVQDIFLLNLVDLNQINSTLCIKFCKLLYDLNLNIQLIDLRKLYSKSAYNENFMRNSLDCTEKKARSSYEILSGCNQSNSCSDLLENVQGITATTFDSCTIQNSFYIQNENTNFTDQNDTNINDQNKDPNFNDQNGDTYIDDRNEDTNIDGVNEDTKFNDQNGNSYIDDQNEDADINDQNEDTNFNDQNEDTDINNQNEDTNFNDHNDVVLEKTENIASINLSQLNKEYNEINQSDDDISSSVSIITSNDSLCSDSSVSTKTDLSNKQITKLADIIANQEHVQYVKMFNTFKNNKPLSESLVLNTLALFKTNKENIIQIYNFFNEILNDFEQQTSLVNEEEFFLQILTINTIAVFRNCKLYKEAAEILLKFYSNLKCLVVVKWYKSNYTHEFSEISKYLYICQIFIRGGYLHQALTILKSPELKLFSGSHAWTCHHFDNFDPDYRNDIIEELISHALQENIQIAKTVILYMINSKEHINEIDIWKYFDQLISRMLDDDKTYEKDLLSLLFNILDGWYKHLSESVLRGLLIKLIRLKVSDKKLIMFYHRCCKQNIYEQINEHNERIILKSDMLTEEIYMTIRYFFSKLVKNNFDAQNICLVIKMKYDVINQPKIVSNANTEIQLIKTKIYKVLAGAFPYAIHVEVNDKPSINVLAEQLQSNVNYYRKINIKSASEKSE